MRTIRKRCKPLTSISILDLLVNPVHDQAMSSRCATQIVWFSVAYICDVINVSSRGTSSISNDNKILRNAHRLSATSTCDEQILEMEYWCLESETAGKDPSEPSALPGVF
jgi:hypothetical protein